MAGGAPDKEAQLLESWKAYKTGFQQGIALFNKKPKKGVAFMVEQVRSRARSPITYILSLTPISSASLWSTTYE